MTSIHILDSGHAHVALLEMRRQPYNYVSEELLRTLADTLERLDADPSVRCTVLAAEGRTFSAGADFGGEGDGIGYHLLHLLFQNTLDLFHFVFRRFHDQFIVYLQ